MEKRGPALDRYDKVFIVIGSAGAAIFLLGLMWYLLDVPHGSDRALLDAIRGLRAPPLTVLFYAFSVLGNKYLLLALGVLFIAHLLLKRKYRLGAELYLLFCFLWSLNLAMKALFSRERPGEDGLLLDAIGGSFPSGHAMVGNALWGTIVIYVFHMRTGYFPWAIAAWSLLAILMCISRVYLGVHYPSDVIAGLGLSCVFMAIVYRILRNERAKATERDHGPRTNTRI